MFVTFAIKRKTKSQFSHHITPHILMPPVPGRQLIIYLTVLEGSMGCVLGKHDKIGRKEHAISARNLLTAKQGTHFSRKLVVHWRGLLKVLGNIC